MNLITRKNFLRALYLFALAWLAVPPVQAANDFLVNIIGTSPTQALLSYTAPTTNPCTVQVSESNNYTPLVHDVDPALFSGANLDSRANSVTSATQRIFLAGKRAIELASDGRKYSRALQQGTLHYFQITCGSKVASGSFTTKTAPFGATYHDLLPMNADGTYNFPDTSKTDRNEQIVDSQTGVLMKHVNLPADNSVNSTPWPTAGGFGRF